MQRKNIIVLFIILVLISSIGMLWPIKQDEGVFLSIAHLWTKNNIPYRDIFDHKTPGIYLFLWPFVRITSSIQLIRLIIIFVNIITSFILYITIKPTHQKSALLSALVYFWLAFVFEGFLILSEPMMALCLTLSYLFFKKEKYFFTGLFAGLAFVFKQPAILALILYLIIFLVEKFPIKNKINNILKYIVGIITVISPIVIYFALNHSLADLYNQTISLNLTSYPPISNRIIYKQIIFPLLISSPIIYIVIEEIIFQIKKRKIHKSDFFLIIFIILTLPILIYRPYPHYWLQILPFAVILVSNKLSSIQKTLILCFLVSLVIFSYQYFSNQRYISADQKSIVQFIKKESNQNNQIYTTRFLPSIYYTNDKKPINKFLYINEISRSESSQAETLSDLKNKKPRFVIWIDPKKYYLEPYAWSISHYINNNYKVVKKYPKSNLVIFELSNDNRSISKPLPVGIK